MTSVPIFKPGRNCWRVEHADRARVLIDGAEYFRAFREAAKQARRSILIVGWDIDSRFQLVREPPEDDLPTGLRDFLNELVRRNRRLRVDVLDWDFPVLYAPDREFLPLYKLEWTTRRRLCFRLDSHYPLGASHHQKIAVIDDAVAFCGGLDFTLGRWDTPEHRPGDVRRRDLDETIPQPYHDIQMMVSGPAARALGDLARQRWHAATGHQTKAPRQPANADAWPKDVEPEFRDVDVAICRTQPKYNNQDEVREIQNLLVDAIAGARRWIYIENQYLTAACISEALSERLKENDPPEIVIVLPEETVGWLSQNTMDVMRERLIKRLREADHRQRMRVYSPYIPGLDGQCLNVHSKLLIVDDDIAIVGSANFNNRSMGLDTECNLAIAAANDNTIREGIAKVRARLLAEHLGVHEKTVVAAIDETESLIQAIESLQQEGRTLKPLQLKVTPELDALVPSEQFADPERAIDSDYLSAQIVGEEDKPPARRALLTFVSVIAAALALAALWRWTPFGESMDISTLLESLSQYRNNPITPVAVALLYVVASFIMFPVTLLIVGTGVAFGAYYGFAFALLGAEAAALATYAAGHLLGHGTLRRFSHKGVARVSQRLAQQGILAMVTLRIVPVAPFTIINLVAGASHIRMRDFAIGTVIGMLPGTLALTLFSDQVVSAINAPENQRIAMLLALAAALVIGGWLLGRWLLRRQERAC